MSYSYASNPTTIRAAQGTAIFLSGTLTGASLALSAFVVPRLLESPVPLMVRQFSRMYRAGTKSMLPGAVTAAAAYFLLAARFGVTDSAQGRGYLTAGVLSISIGPYTHIVMMGLIKRLLAREEGVESVQREFGKSGGAEEGEAAARVVEETAWVKKEGSRYLVDRWATMNLGRSALLAMSTAVALWSTLC